MVPDPAATASPPRPRTLIAPVAPATRPVASVFTSTPLPNTYTPWNTPATVDPASPTSEISPLVETRSAEITMLRAVTATLPTIVEATPEKVTAPAVPAFTVSPGVWPAAVVTPPLTATLPPPVAVIATSPASVMPPEKVWLPLPEASVIAASVVGASSLIAPPLVVTESAMLAAVTFAAIERPPVSVWSAWRSVRLDVFTVPASVTTSWLTVPVPEGTLAPVARKPVGVIESETASFAASSNATVSTPLVSEMVAASIRRVSSRSAARPPRPRPSRPAGRRLRRAGSRADRVRRATKGHSIRIAPRARRNEAGSLGHPAVAPLRLQHDRRPCRFRQ